MSVQVVEFGEAFSAAPLTDDDIEADHFFGKVACADLCGSCARLDPDPGVGAGVLGERNDAGEFEVDAFGPPPHVRLHELAHG